MGHDSLSTNMPELFGMLWTTYMMIVIRKEVHGGEMEAVLLRGHNASAVQQILRMTYAPVA